MFGPTALWPPGVYSALSDGSAAKFYAELPWSASVKTTHVEVNVAALDTNAQYKVQLEHSADGGQNWVALGTDVISNQSASGSKIGKNTEDFADRARAVLVVSASSGGARVSITLASSAATGKPF